jgi:formate dehydrogenase subunit gamma
MNKNNLYQRFNLHQRLQHGLIIISFTLCAVTGLPIKYHDAELSKWVIDLFGGFDSILNTHLFAALLIILACLYHLIYMPIYSLRTTGKFPWPLMLNLKDLKDIVIHIKYQLGLSDQKAQFDRYSYKEKFDYIAVFWGMFIIGGSGALMWFPDWAAKYFPRWVIESYRVGHSDEAVLAVLAIFVWHFYNVHFSPDFFPMNKVFWDGKIDGKTMAHEHPLELARLEGIDSIEADIPMEETLETDDVQMKSKNFSQSKGLIITEMIIYGAILIWFLAKFLPHGFH